MSIAPMQLAYLPQNDQNALLDWAREHWNMHKQVQQKAVEQGKTDSFPYSVADMVDLEDWLYFHYEEHLTIATNFNTPSPPDLSYWDQSDKTNFDNWLMSHALVHEDVRKALNL